MGRTTTDEKNSYVDIYGQHIMLTITNETTSDTNDGFYTNYALNISNDGGYRSYTSNKNSSCIMTSNPVKGNMIPPVRSARLSIMGTKGIRYGRVAKLSERDWLWSTIWTLLEDSVGEDWPRSGESDIMESSSSAHGKWRLGEKKREFWE